MTNGVTQTGAISTIGELDEWTFNADQGDALYVQIGEILVPPGTPDPGYYPWIRLIGPTGTILGTNWDNLAASLAVEAPLTGQYRVIAGAAFNATGSYRLTLAKAPGPFQTGAGDEGGALTNGGRHVGHIDLGDIDMWSFTAGQGDALYLRVGEIPVAQGQPDPGYYPWIRLVGPNGDILATNWDNLDAGVAVAAPLTGTYTALVSATYPAVGDYRLTLAKAPGTFEVPDEDQGGPLTNGRTHTGAVDLGDIDMWSFSANQGDALYVRMAEIAVSPGQPDPGFYPWLRLIGPNGAVLRTNWDNLDAAVAIEAPLTGTYTVLTAATYTTSGAYRLTLAKAPGTYEVPAGDEGGPLTNGVSTTGRIVLGDVDMFNFAANQGEALYLRIGEVPVGPSVPDPGFYPWLQLIGPNGDILGTNWDNLDAGVAATAPLTGNYTLLVAAAYTTPGDYRLTLAKAPGAFQTGAGDQGGPMTNGVDHGGLIPYGDIDMWSFNTCQGQSVTLVMTEVPVPPTDPDPGFYPWYRIVGPTGITVATNWGNVSATSTFTPTLSGPHTVFAAANYPATGEYLIRVIGGCTPVPPTSVNDAYTTPHNTALVVAAPGVLANDSAPGATVAVVQNVSSGTLNLNTNGGFTYTPASGFSGVVTFTYRATNGNGPGNIATVSITVGAAQLPTAAADSYAATAGQALVVPVPGVLSNDVSPGGSAMTATLVSPTSNGGISLGATGGFTYTPNSGFAGADTFTYRVSNANGQGNVATVTITVTNPTTLLAPTGLVAHEITGSMVTLRWTPPVGGIAPTDYVLDGGVVPGQVLASVPVGGTTPILTFAAPNGAFYVRMRALAGAQSSAPSNEIRIFVNQAVPPSAPSHLLGMVNGASVALSWRPTFGGGTTSTFVLDVTGSLNTSLPLGVTDTFTFNGVPGGTYTFTVRAVNGSGSSAPSAPVTLSFPNGCLTAPLTPEDFLAYRVGNNVRILWNPASSGGAPTSYVLNVTGAFNGSLPMPSRGVSAFVGPGSYTLAVAAINACGTSAATAPQTVTVP